MSALERVLDTDVVLVEDLGLVLLPPLLYLGWVPLMHDADHVVSVIQEPVELEEIENQGAYTVARSPRVGIEWR